MLNLFTSFFNHSYVLFRIFKLSFIIFPSTTKSYDIPSYSGIILKSSGIVVLLFGFCIMLTCPLVSNIAYSTSARLFILFALNLSCNSFIVKRSFISTFSFIFPLYIKILGFPHISCLIFMLFKFIKEIIKCITNKLKIGIIPFIIGIPTSLIGTDAKSAIIIAIASSNGCN